MTALEPSAELTFSYTKSTFKVRVGVILIHEDKLLLTRQNKRDFWVFPGGTLEPGEGLEECAIREIKEESNLEISITKLLYIADFMHAQRQTIDVFFLGKYLRGNLVMETSENLDDMDFFTVDEIANITVEPSLISQQVLTDWRTGFNGTDGRYLGKYWPKVSN